MLPTTPLHPALVHVPIGISVAIPLVCFLLYAGTAKGWFTRKAWAIVAALQLIAFVGGAVSFKTGGTEEDRVKNVVKESVVDEHEERAEAFLWVSGLTTAASLASVFIPAANIASLARVATTIGSIAAAGTVLWTGKSGGELVYVHGAASAYSDRSAHPPTKDTDND